MDDPTSSTTPASSDDPVERRREALTALIRELTIAVAAIMAMYGLLSEMGVEGNDRAVTAVEYVAVLAVGRGIGGGLSKPPRS